nr:sugar O-acetyltransferase [uncultured Actinomyces sp.]
MTLAPGTTFDDPRFRDDERTPSQRMADGDFYVADDVLAAHTKRAVRLLSLYEQAHPTDPDIARYLLAQVIGSVGEGVDIRPPLRVDYGHNITIGDGSWVNFGLTALDVAPIVIGQDVLIGPNCSLYTAIHPTEPGPRRAKWESAAPIALGDNVWLGGSVVVCPGVTIGENSIIGAGAVVTRDIPANSIAVGNPARVIRALDPTLPRPIQAASVGVIR